MADDLEKKVTDLICEVKDGELSPEDVSADKSFRNDLDFDSLDMASLMMKVEEEFEDDGLTELPQEEIDELETVGSVVDYLRTKLEQNA